MSGRPPTRCSAKRRGLRKRGKNLRKDSRSLWDGPRPAPGDQHTRGTGLPPAQPVAQLPLGNGERVAPTGRHLSPSKRL